MLELQPGQVISGFEVKSRIGKGGMGAVYLVHDKGLGVDRALKVISIPAEEGDDEEQQTARERFSREARTLAKLRHNNIISVHTVGEVAGTPFLVMTHFPSVDLRAWVTTNPSLSRVVAACKQVASALSYAHKQGVIHRDIKLSNILVNGDDEVMIIDFGLAKAADDQQLTRTGRSMGTFAYMAPEYVAAAMTGHAEHTALSDLWALGCVMYALCTHKPAFADPDDVKLLGKVQKGEYVPVDKLRTDIAPELARIIHGLLTVDPGRRTQTADVLLGQLSALSHPTDPAKAPWTPPSSSASGALPTANLRAKAPASSSASPISGFSVDVNSAPPVPSRTGDSGASLGDPFAAVKPSDLPPLSAVSRLAPPPSEPSASAVVEVGSLVAPAPRAGLLVTPKPPPASTAPSPSASQSMSAHAPTSQPGGDLSVFSAALAGEQAPSRIAVSPLPPSPSPTAAPHQGAPHEAHPLEAATPSVTSMPPPRFTAEAPKAPPSTNKALRNLILPAAGAAIVFLVGAFVVNWSSSVSHTPKKGEAGFVDPDTVTEQRSAEGELRALEREKREAAAKEKERQAQLAAAAVNAVPLAPPPAPAPASADQAPASSAASPPEAAAGRAPKKGKGAAAPAAAMPAPADDPWAARYGSRTSFNTTSVAATSAKPGTDQTASPTAGVRIQARLDGALASSPAGPVIAITTAQSKVGDVVIPQGSQIHGSTQGTSGSRILVSFSFAIINGRNVPLRATAVGTDGRGGIPGTKSLGGGSDVAAGGAGGAIRGAGDAVADAVGDNLVGDAVRGATSPAGQKTSRLNNEEDLVTTTRGARFVIYVESLGTR